MEKMKPINEDTDDQAITDSIDLMAYLQDNFLQNRGSSNFERPDWMNDHNNDSSASEDDEKDSTKKTQICEISSKFSKK